MFLKNYIFFSSYIKLHHRNVTMVICSGFLGEMARGYFKHFLKTNESNLSFKIKYN